MLARIRTSAILGLEASPVDVEVQVRDGPHRFTIIGLGDGAIKESRDRILSAITQSGFQLPRQILVNLAPAEMRKEGSSFDLPIAIGILAASGQLSQRILPSCSVYGEVSLAGGVKGVKGILSLAIEALQAGQEEIIIPADNQLETSLLTGLKVTPVDSLRSLARYLNGGPLPQFKRQPAACIGIAEGQKLISDVWGQDSAKRALLIAAAGAHNLLMVGPPGCGKSMLAERLPSLLPPLEDHEKHEVMRIQSVAGQSVLEALHGRRPFRSPHHIISDAGLIGGGSIPKPGEVSLAHRGVLFLDEFPEFSRSAIEAMRAPLENGTVRISRSRGSAAFPARFQLVAAMNPCPCGRLGTDANNSCLCSRPAVAGYLRKLSQPILDRIDLQVELRAVPLSKLAQPPPEDALSQEEALRAQVQAARRRQLARQRSLNAHLEAKLIGTTLPIDPKSRVLVEKAFARSALSARGFIKTLKVACTIADLEGADSVTVAHVSEALSFRGLNRIHSYVHGSSRSGAEAVW